MFSLTHQHDGFFLTTPSVSDACDCRLLRDGSLPATRILTVYFCTILVSTLNGSGSSIYVRPSRSLSAHPWILVDHLDISAKASITEHHPPAAFVETSSDHWQAWIHLDRPLEADARAKVARWLAETYSGNPGTAEGSPFGRLPGFTNQNPHRREPDEMAPFTRLTEVHPEHVMDLASLPVSVTLAAREMRSDGPPNRRAQARDQDFAIARRLVEIGQDDTAIAAVIQAVRKDAKAHHNDYIKRTIVAARQRVNQQMEPT